MMRGTYGGKSATIHLVGLPGDAGYGRTCSVHLDQDPGSGSMNFYGIGTTQVVVTEARAEEYRAMAAEIRNTAKYLDVSGGTGYRDAILGLANLYAESAC